LEINFAEKYIEELTLSIDKAEMEEGFLKNEDTGADGETRNINKDDFSMDPIFNEIIEPSLRINSGTEYKTSVNV
jgi:hypothetical protein